MDMVRSMVPGILVNGRSGLPGDFSTPEGHITASDTPWEGCITLNDHWGYHVGDHAWKSPRQVISMLQQCAVGGGNLLLNVGPAGDGTVPEASLHVLDSVGAWLKPNGSAIYGTDRFTMDLQQRGEHRADWCHHGAFTVHGHTLDLLVTSWPGETLVICGLECQVQSVCYLADGRPITWKQDGGRLTLSALPAVMDTTMPVVISMQMDRPPVLYKSGGRVNPKVDHCRYDPCPSEIQGGPH
jgi:alpha-L-fucosidase